MMTPTSTPDGPLRLLIVEDHALVRLGLFTLLARAGGRLEILEARTLAQAIEVYGAHTQGIALVLLDLHLPDAHGLSGLRDFLRRFPRAPVVVLSGNTDPALMRQARNAGALAYFGKSDQMDDVVCFVQAHCRRLSEGTAGGWEGRIDAADATDPGRIVETLDGERVRLTRRQADLLDRVLAGQSNREIAGHVHLAEGTVKNHVSALLLLLGARSRTQIVSRLR
jgi:DNA-binding NarL/FixJ family response regulator